MAIWSSGRIIFSDRSAPVPVPVPSTTRLADVMFYRLRPVTTGTTHLPVAIRSEFEVADVAEMSVDIIHTCPHQCSRSPMTSS